jgi:transposase
VAAVAQAHGLNANLVHKWRRCRDAGQLSSTARVTAAKLNELSLPPARAAARTAASVAGGVAVTAQQPAATPFVPVQLGIPHAARTDIRLELHRGAATVIVSWPVQEAAACGSWLREWLE